MIVEPRLLQTMFVNLRKHLINSQFEHIIYYYTQLIPNIL